MASSHAARPGGVALLGCLLTSGCYLGSARNASLAELAGHDGWELVKGVPEVRQVSRDDCGAAALTMVLGYWGLPVTFDHVRAANPTTPERGIRAVTLRDFARQQGLQAFLIPGQLGDLDREIHLHHPVLVGVMKRYSWRTYPHYEVVVGINHKEQRILTLDPAHGLRVNGREEFATEWAKTGQLTMVIFPQDAVLPMRPQAQLQRVGPLSPSN